MGKTIISQHNSEALGGSPPWELPHVWGMVPLSCGFSQSHFSTSRCFIKFYIIENLKLLKVIFKKQQNVKQDIKILFWIKLPLHLKEARFVTLLVLQGLGSLIRLHRFVVWGLFCCGRSVFSSFSLRQSRHHDLLVWVAPLAPSSHSAEGSWRSQDWGWGWGTQRNWQPSKKIHSHARVTLSLECSRNTESRELKE